MSNGNSLVNFGDLAKPVTKLVTKISNAVEGSAKPWQIRRVAAAQADATVMRAAAEKEAAIIEAQADIEKTDLHRRAANRWINEQAQLQLNMEDIARLSLPMVNEDARPDEMEDDWIVNFFDKGRLISDDDMQALWARILAGEANSPGSYSKRTVNALAELDKSDAELFRALCGFVWTLGESSQPLVFDYLDPIYKDCGLRFENLQHLDAIGLLRLEVDSYRFFFDEDENPVISYYGRSLVFDAPSIDTEFSVGQVLLTKSGVELSGICGGEEVEGFYEYALDKLPSHFVPVEKNCGRGRICQ